MAPLTSPGALRTTPFRVGFNVHHQASQSQYREWNLIKYTAQDGGYLFLSTYIEIEKLAQYHKPLIYVFLEILKNTKLKPFEFDRGEMTYKLLNDETHRWRSEKFSSLSEFQVKTTRSNFPSDKLTLNIGKMTRSKFVQWFTLLFQLSGKNDVDLILEDTKRKSFNFDMIDYFFHAFTSK